MEGEAVKRDHTVDGQVDGWGHLCSRVRIVSISQRWKGTLPMYMVYMCVAPQVLALCSVLAWG